MGGRYKFHSFAGVMEKPNDKTSRVPIDIFSYILVQLKTTIPAFHPSLPNP